MDPIEIKQVLSSMVILHDSREHETDQARRRYEAFGVPHNRAYLCYGDYTFNATLPDGSMIYDQSSEIFPAAVIERKMDFAELSQCLFQGRERFDREFKRAAEHGARIYLLVEGASWENLIAGKYKTKVHPNAFLGSLVAWVARYNMVPIFCRAETTPRMIREILYRELKERLERGEYDARLDNTAAEADG